MVSLPPTDINVVVAPTTGLFKGGQPYDLIDLPTLKDDLGIVDGASDSFLARAITRVSENIRRHCNRTFQVQGYVESFWAYRDPYPWQLPGGFGPLQLSQWPIAGSPSLAGTAPPLPSGLTSIAGGALPQQNCFVRTTFVTPFGETGTSTEQNLIVPAGSLLVVGTPLPDPLAVATGWNVYVSTAAGTEVRQNGAPIALGAAWTEPVTGLIVAPQGPALPQYVAVTENISNVNTSSSPTNLAEGIDYTVDRPRGQLTRFFSDGYPRRWPALPLVVQYWAGYSAIPADLQDGCTRLVKAQYFARFRDPNLRQENVVGALEQGWWFAAGPGSDAGYPPDIAAMLDAYRVPVFA